MKKTMIWGLAVFLIFTSLSFGQSYPRVSNYQLDIEFNPDLSTICGKAVVAFENVITENDTAGFYLHSEFMVDSILQNGRHLEFSQEKVYFDYSYTLIANKVQFTLPENLKGNGIDVYYAGKFNRSESRCLSDYMRIDSDGVFLRSYGYSLWFPIFLGDRSQSHTVDVSKATFSYPSDYECVFVGNRLDESINDDIKISVWSASNIDLTDYQITVQKLGVLSDDWLNVYYWKDSISTAKAKDILEFTRWFNVECDKRFMKNRLPEQYFIVEMPKFGDIASDNTTGISDRLWKIFGESNSSISTFAHEIVHSYVQIPIERNDPLYAFIWEGFPSYFDDLLLGEYMGKDWFQNELIKLEKSYLKKKETGLNKRGRKLPVDKPLDKITADEIGSYKDQFILTSRTSLFFNYLSEKMGSKDYSSFERELFDYQKITNKQFRELVLKYLPDYEDDIDIWLSSVDYPDRFRLENLN